MSAALQRTSLDRALALSLAASGPVEAARVKYTYLKVGEGGRASVYAFTSKPACEAARRKHDASWNSMIAKLKKQIGNRGTFAKPPRTRCMDTLPLGFEGKNDYQNTTLRI